MGSVRVLAVTLACVGCVGSDPAQPDAADVCPVPPGRSYIERVELAGPGVGFDLNGDGTIDNAFGNLPPTLRDQLNKDVESSFDTGSQFFVLNLANWDPPTANAADVVTQILLVRDADTDPSNNFNGTGTFYADALSFDLDCEPKIKGDHASITNGMMTADAKQFEIPFLNWQTLTFSNVQATAAFDSQFMFASLVTGGTVLFCTLSQSNVQGQTGTLLELLVNNQASLGVYPDIDVDGDGVETVVTDGTYVTECIDGDGTHIPGPNCACDPRIQDGYSLTIVGDAAFVRIVGAR
jgi:hypothetical protein